VALAFGLATWWLCSYVSARAEAQTAGMTVPVDMQVYREVSHWLWFPFSWIPLPESHRLGDWQQSLRSLLIGVPYGVIVGLAVYWLFGSRQPKKI
jgi:hypothetical protein